MTHGYAGRMLRVDLNTGSVKKDPLPPKLIENYIGGRGFVARLLWEELEPGIDPADRGRIRSDGSRAVGYRRHGRGRGVFVGRVGDLGRVGRKANRGEAPRRVCCPPRPRLLPSRIAMPRGCSNTRRLPVPIGNHLC